MVSAKRVPPALASNRWIGWRDPSQGSFPGFALPSTVPRAHEPRDPNHRGAATQRSATRGKNDGGLSILVDGKELTSLVDQSVEASRWRMYGSAKRNLLSLLLADNQAGIVTQSVCGRQHGASGQVLDYHAFADLKATDGGAPEVP